MNISILAFLAGRESLDPSVIDYQSRVPTLQPEDAALLNTFVSVMQANGTFTGYEFYPNLGGFSGFLQKLNPINPAIPALTNNGFISGDYSENGGITNNGSKWLGTGIIPVNQGLAYNNLSFGGFIKDQVNGSAQYFFAQRPASGGMQAYIGKTAIGVAGGTLQKLIPAPGANNPKLLGMSLRTTESIFRHGYWDLLPPAPVASVPTTQTLDQELTIFQARSFGATVNASGTMSFGWCGPSMTRSQMDVFTAAVYGLMSSKGRYTSAAELVLIGDSYTYGNQSSAFSTRYAYLTAVALGLRENNGGIGGSTLRNSASQLYSEYDRRYTLLKANYTNPNTVFVLASGLNDARADSGANGTPATIADAKTKLITEIQELLSAGISANKIVVCGIAYIEDGTPATRLQAWNTMKQQAASETGVRFADWYTPTQANWNTIKYTDNIHIIDAGHILLRDSILSALA